MIFSGSHHKRAIFFQAITLKNMKNILFHTNRKPTEVLLEFIFYSFTVIVFWGVNMKFIPNEWHLFSGWISAVIYFGMVDLIETINDVE